MDEVNNVPMVTIPLDEYFELKTKAHENLYLANQLGRMDARFEEMDRRIYELMLRMEKYENAQIRKC